MEYQKITNLLMIHQINHLNLKQTFGLKQSMNPEEDTVLIVKLILKLQCESLFYVITVMHTYLLRGE